MESKRYATSAIVVGSFLIGVAIRVAARDYPPSDGDLYVTWYNLAREGGLNSLRQGLTNYAPFYSLLFYGATLLDCWLSIFASIKLISLPFELGSAIVSSRLIAIAAPSTTKPAWAFAAVWLAPTVIFNGALWAQADAVWTFFILLSIYLICRSLFLTAMLAFAVAVSVKLQATFFGPVILALVLRRKLRLISLALVPIVYLLTALPVILIGRSIKGLLLIYADQAQFFQQLSKNAANLWIFVPNEFYYSGVISGLFIATVAGVAFSARITREPEWTPFFVILASATCLQLMPWALPKMHERYFYAFEITVIIAAIIEPRLVFLATVAQLNALLVYVGVDLGQGGLGTWGPPFAAMINSVVLMTMIRRLTTGVYVDPSLAFLTVIISYILWLSFVAATAADEAAILGSWPATKTDFNGLLNFLLILLLCASAIFLLASLTNRKQDDEEAA